MNRIYKHTYDQTAALKTRERYDNGTLVEREVYTYDESGLATRVETDYGVSGIDGIIDQTAAYAYGPDGIMQELHDFGADGSVNMRVDYSWDGGRLLAKAWDGWNTNPLDGQVDRRESYSYDVGGQRTRTDHDSDGDGTIDDIWFYVAYDAMGNVVSEERDLDADGVVDWAGVSMFEYDVRWRVLRWRYESDQGADGVCDWESETVYIYDCL